MVTPDAGIDSRERSRRDSTAHANQLNFKHPGSLSSTTTPALQQKRRHSPPSGLPCEDANARPGNAVEHHLKSVPQIPAAMAPPERSFLDSSAPGSLHKRQTCTETSAFPAMPQHPSASQELILDLPSASSWPPLAPSATISQPRVPRPARRISFRAPSSTSTSAVPAHHPSSNPAPERPRHHSIISAQASGLSTPQGPASGCDMEVDGTAEGPPAAGKARAAQDFSLLAAARGRPAAESRRWGSCESQDGRHHATAGAERNQKPSPATARPSSADVSDKAGLKRSCETSSAAERPRAGKRSRGSSPEGPYAAVQSEAAVVTKGPRVVPELASAPGAAHTEGKAMGQETSRKLPAGFELNSKGPGKAPSPGTPSLEAPPLPSHDNPAANAHLQKLRIALELSRSWAREKKVLSARSSSENRGYTEQPGQAKGDDRWALSQPCSLEQEAEREAQKDGGSNSHEGPRGQENRPVLKEAVQSPRSCSAHTVSNGGAGDSKSCRPGEAIQRGGDGDRRGRDRARVEGSLRTSEQRHRRYDDDVRGSMRYERWGSSSRGNEGSYRSRRDEVGYCCGRYSDVNSRRDEERYSSRRSTDTGRSDRRRDERYGSSRRSEDRYSSRGQSEERRDGGAEEQYKRVPEQREKAGAGESGESDVVQIVAVATAKAAKLAAFHKAAASPTPAILGTAQSAEREASGDAQGVPAPLAMGDPTAAVAGEDELQFQPSTMKAGSSSKSLMSIRAAAAKKAIILKSVKLPHFVKLLAGGPINPEVQALNARLKEVDGMLKSGRTECGTVLPGEAQPPSPPPVYNSAGVRTSTRENLAREALRKERQEIIAELLKKDPTYKAPPGFRPPKLYRKIPVPVNDFPNFNFVGFLLGPRGSNQKRMEKESGARIFLRGRQMQLGAHPSWAPHGAFAGADSSDDEPLHVLIEASSSSSLEAAAGLIQKQLATSPQDLHRLQAAQLQELAVIIGTQRKPDARFACGEPGHLQYNCPQSAASFQAGVNCPICGDSSHTSSDCPKSRRSEAGSSAASIETLGEGQSSFEDRCFLEESGAGQPELGAYFHAMGEAGEGQSLFSESGAIQSSFAWGQAGDAQAAAGGAAEGGGCAISAASAGVAAGSVDGGAAASHSGVAAAPANASAAAVAAATQHSSGTGAAFGVAGRVPEAPSSGCRLRVGSLPWAMNNYQLRQLFEAFGELEEAIVVRERYTGRSRGFGFVHYKSKHAAIKALHAMEKYRIGNCFLAVRVTDDASAFPQQRPPPLPQQQQQQQQQQQGFLGGLTGPGEYWGAGNAVPTAYPPVSAPPAYHPYPEHEAAYMPDPAGLCGHYAGGVPGVAASYQAYAAYAPAGYDGNQAYYQPTLDECGNPAVCLGDASGSEEREFPPGLEPDQESEGPPGVDKEGDSEGKACGAPAAHQMEVAGGDASIYGTNASGTGGYSESTGCPTDFYYWGANTAGAAALTTPAPAVPSLVASPPAGDELPPGEDPSHWMAAEAAAATQAALAAPLPPGYSTEPPLITYTDAYPQAHGGSNSVYTTPLGEPSKDECVATAEDGIVVEDETDYIIKGELPLGMPPGYPGLAAVQAEP